MELGALTGPLKFPVLYGPRVPFTGERAGGKTYIGIITAEKGIWTLEQPYGVVILPQLGHAKQGRASQFLTLCSGLRQSIDQRAHVVGWRRFETQFFAGHGMGEAEQGGVKGLASQGF